jgi:hypothetical protein
MAHEHQAQRLVVAGVEQVLEEVILLYLTVEMVAMVPLLQFLEPP